MIKVQITDTEHPDKTVNLEGEVALCAVLNERENDFAVRTGLVGRHNHPRAISLIRSASKAIGEAIGDCTACRMEAASASAAALMTYTAKMNTEEPATAGHDEAASN